MSIVTIILLLCLFFVIHQISIVLIKLLSILKVPLFSLMFIIILLIDPYYLIYLLIPFGLFMGFVPEIKDAFDTGYEFGKSFGFPMAISLLIYFIFKDYIQITLIWEEPLLILFTLISIRYASGLLLGLLGFLFKVAVDLLIKFIGLIIILGKNIIDGFFVLRRTIKQYDKVKIKLSYRSFSILLPKEHREEYLGDLIEYRQYLKAQGFSKTKIRVWLFVQIVSILSASVWQKIAELVSRNKEVGK